MRMPLPATDRETRRCPQCQAALVLNPHSAALSADVLDNPDPFKDRLHYEAA